MASTTSTPIKRVITCQGSIQLVTALSVLSHREREQGRQRIEYENYLVIYDLYAPGEQNEEFAEFIKKMAVSVCAWKAIVYLNPEQLQTIAEQTKYTAPAKVFDTVHRLVGVDAAAEIYLSRNWQFGNQLLLNAYSSAQKICYGDSIGLYFSSNSIAFSPIKIESHASHRPFDTLITDSLKFLRFQGGTFLCYLQENLNLRTVLKTVEFDVGYFTLPDILGEIPPMPIVLLDKSVLLETIHQLKGLVNSEYIANFREITASVPVSILLTSNFSEAGRISQTDEINAYRQFLVSEGISFNTVLVIKPHPRDSIDKIQKLKQTLSDLFKQIIVLSEPNLFFLPFEIFFLAAFLRPDLVCKSDIRAFAVSSSCLALKLLFDVPSVVGFSSEISSALFNTQYVSGRLSHEKQLRTAIQKLGNCALKMKS
jgi:Alpha-2,8-polysialyltransferase (POLYST)